MKILTCFTSVQLYTQGGKNVPVDGNDPYGPCDNWWSQVMFDNALFITVSCEHLLGETLVLSLHHLRESLFNMTRGDEDIEGGEGFKNF